jgi:hypothetical protein
VKGVVLVGIRQTVLVMGVGAISLVRLSLMDT